MNLTETLFILPCTKTKIWGSQPSIAPTPAENAYTGQLFLKGRRFVTNLGGTYIILSAKYGWLRPETPIHNYNETFKSCKPNLDLLVNQALQGHFLLYPKVVVLGGSVYAKVCYAVFLRSRIYLPLQGMPIGKMLQALTPPTTDLESKVWQFINS